MKMRKLFSFLLALLMALAAALPARAAEGDVQAQDPASVPEESPTEGEVPDWLLEPEGGETESDPPADTAAPENPVVPETPVIPETPENPENPGEILPPAEPETPENPETPEDPDQTVDPEIPETPVIPETPEVPETPVSPDTPVQPPDWLLPPEETPTLPAAPGADEPALLPPENAVAEEAPVINVLVPSSGQIVINPYRLPVELDGQTSTDQIVSAPLILQNLSIVPVSVSASVTGAVPPGSGVSFAAAPPAPDSPVKEIYLFAEFQPLSDPILQPAWSGQYSDSTNQLLVGFQSTAKDGVLRLEAGGFGAMRLFGSAAVSPMVPWQAGDDIQASFVFSFTPVVEVSDVPAMDETPVTETPAAELPAVDAPVTDVPAVDIPVPAEPASIPEPVPDSLPGWLLES